MNYEFQKGPDNITWVTLEPLIEQTKLYLEKSKQIDVSNMDNHEIKGIDFTILSLEAVYNFLKSLQTEAEIRKMLEEKKNEK